MTLLENALDHVFDTLELYSLQSVFGVTERQARHMVLPHHAGLDLRNPRDRGAGSSNGTPKESTELSERQRDLTRRINAARSASYALTLAMQASERRLRRARAVHSCLSALLGATESGDDAKDAVQDTSKRLLKAVEVIKVHRALLIDSIEKLKAEGPLGKALTHPTSTLELEKGKLNNAAEGADAVQPWSSGREGYLRWQTQRMLSSIRRANGPWDNSADPADSSPRLAKGSQASSRKRKSILEERDEKRLSSQPSLAMHSSEGGMEGEEVGAANEMEVSVGALSEDSAVALAERCVYFLRSSARLTFCLICLCLFSPKALADLLQHRPGHPASCGSTPVSPLKKQT